MQQVEPVFLCTLWNEKKYGFVLTKHGRLWYLMTLDRLRRFFRTEADNLSILETAAKKENVLK